MIYYLAKPNESYNNKGNEADVQDLPFLSSCWKTGMVATLSMNTCSRRTLPCPSLYSCIVSFHSTSEDNVNMTEWHQDYCPNGLVSLYRQDLDKALAGTATAALSPLHICSSSSKCSSEPNSFVGHETNREGQVTGSWGGEVWRRMVGKAFRKNVKDVLMECTARRI